MDSSTREYNSRNYKLILFVRHGISINLGINTIKSPEKKPKNTVKTSPIYPV